MFPVLQSAPFHLNPYYFADLRENYRETVKNLDLSEDQLVQLAKNSFKSSFLSPKEKPRYLEMVDDRNVAQFLQKKLSGVMRN